MKEKKIFIPSESIQLEGFLSIQEACSVKGSMILCHPHPQYGGEMNHPVLINAVEAASQEGFSTLRFNFRGVGESGGSYGDGIGEQKDVEAAIDYLYSRQKDVNGPFIILGYSFGAWVGLSIAVRDNRVKGMVAVAPPLELYDFLFLKGTKKQKLFVAGSRDFFCPSPLLQKWYRDLDEPKSLTILEGADHFFFGHHRALIQPLREFLRRCGSGV